MSLFHFSQQIFSSKTNYNKYTKTKTKFNTNEDKFGYTGGAYINLGPVLKVYIPLFDSPFVQDVYDLQNVTSLTDRMVFTLNLNLVNLVELKNTLEDADLF